MNNLRYDPVKVSFNQTSCVICLEDFQLNEEITKLACNHIFHPSCQQQLAQYRVDCATCRIPFRERQISTDPLLFLDRNAAAVLVILRGSGQSYRQFVMPHLNALRHQTPYRRYRYAMNLAKEKRICFLAECLNPFNRTPLSSEIFRDVIKWHQLCTLAKATVGGLCAGLFVYWALPSEDA